MITLEELKRYLGITDNDDDVLLQELIDSAEAYIENYTGRIFPAQDYTNKKYDGHGERIFLLDNFPLNSITEIKYRDNDDFSAPTYVLVEGKDFDYNEDGEIYFNFNIRRGFKVLDITYNAGYDPIPADLKNAVKQLCGYQYNTREASGIKSENIEGVSIVYADVNSSSTYNSVNAILDNYKNYV